MESIMYGAQYSSNQIFIGLYKNLKYKIKTTDRKYKFGLEVTTSTGTYTNKL